MSNGRRIEGEEEYEEENSRKRQLEASKSATSLQTPPKKARFGSSWGSLFTPFASLVTMFRSDKRDEDEEEEFERSFETSDDFASNEVVTIAVKKKNNSPKKSPSEIVYLNEEYQEENGVENEIQTVVVKRRSHSNKTNSSSEIVFLNNETRAVAGMEKKEEEIDENSVKEEVQVVEEEQPNQSTFEIQEEEEEEEPEVVYEKENDVEVLETKLNRNKRESALNKAQRMQNEIIFLNEHEKEEEEEEEEDGDSDILSIDPSSPQPEDSASRTATPSSFLSAAPLSTTRPVRDFWKSSSLSAKRKTPKRNSRLQFGTDGGSFLVHRQSPSTIKKNKRKTFNNAGNNEKSSLEKYVQELVKIGVFSKKNRQNTETSGQSRAEVLMSQVKQKISEYGSSRSVTPSILSRESSIGPERFNAGAQTPSSSSEHSSTAESRLQEMLSKFKSVEIREKEKFRRYSEVHRNAERRNLELNEEIRIRGLVREQTLEEREEEIRRKLSMRGIFLKEKKKKDEFPELPSNAKELVSSAWNKSLSVGEEFVEGFNAKITRKDLLTLSGISWLNDEIINFYMQMIVERSEKVAGYPKTYAFNTFFWQNISTKGYATVKRWTRKVDIFSYDVILVPVHLQMHWCMSVIDLRHKHIDYYDSLMGMKKDVIPNLQKYLMEESQDKKKQPFDFDGWEFTIRTDIPRQKNGSDCGVFACQFGEFASRRAEIVFSQDNMQYYRRRMVFEICSKKLMSSI